MNTLPKYKICSKCKVNKPILDYYKRPDRLNQVRPKCKLCEKSLALEYYHSDQERAAEYRNQTRERKAAWSKKYNQTEKRKIASAAQRVKNREQRAQYNKKWRAANKEKAAQTWRNRRAKLLNVASDNYTKEQVLDKWGVNCHICNRAIDLNAPRKPKAINDKSFFLGLHLDHNQSLSDGGDDTLENVRPAHAICNLRKGTS